MTNRNDAAATGISRAHFLTSVGALAGSLALAGCTDESYTASTQNASGVLEGSTSSTPEDGEQSAGLPPEEHRAFPAHKAYGTSHGICPGRVTWVHDARSVAWDGNDHWWNTNNYDEPVVSSMLSQALCSIAGNAASPAEAWNALFVDANRRASGGVMGSTGNNPAGYQQDETICIKIDMSGWGGDGLDEESDLPFTNPVVLRALLNSLVHDAGVQPSGITVTDPSRVIPSWMQAYCRKDGLDELRFLYYDDGGQQDAIAEGSAAISWSAPVEGEACVLPRCVASEATYLINLATLKGHSAFGVSLCAANWIGALETSDRLNPATTSGIYSLIAEGAMDTYSPLVDLMAHYQLGRKTMLYLLDGLIAAPREDVPVTLDTTSWQGAPFNGQPCASIMCSQDPVAIDSVAADLLIAQQTVLENNSTLAADPRAEHYLHEAACAEQPPSGTTYLDGAGAPIGSLGVHEHRDENGTYLRNRGAAEGIELVQIEL